MSKFNRLIYNGAIHQLYGSMGSFVIGATKHPRNVLCITGNSDDNDKEFLAEYIAYRYQYKKLRLNDPLKEVANILFDFGPSTDVVDHKWSITPKQAISFIENEILNNKITDLLPYIKKDFLAHLLYYKISNTNCSYVISDLKTQNEYNVLSRLHPIIIKLNDNTKKEDNSILYHIHIQNDGNTESIIKQFDHDFHL